MTDPGKPHVFVSYARADESKARTIVRALEGAGLEVWWDDLIRGGERYSGRIADALDQSAVVVVLWSPAANESNWVKDEAQSGADRGCLVPVTLGAVQPPLGFRQFQTIPLDSDGGLQRIVEAVLAIAGRPAAPATRAVAVPPRRRPRTRLAVAAGAVAIAAAAAVVLGRGALPGGSGGAPEASHSVAVLPFENMSGDPGRNYFAEGVSAEIRAALARNPRLKVAAQTSSDAAGKDRSDARDTARKLNVAYLLEGNVRRAGERVRVSAELIEGASGFTSWSQTFDRPDRDVFAVQDEIAGAVASALNARLGGKAAAGQGAGGTESLPAYDAFLRGQHLLDEASGEASDRAALAAFDQALTADPAYARAHAARARALAIIANQYADGTERQARYADAIAAARRAVELAPESAAAQSALGYTLFTGALDARGAAAAYRRSAELGSGDADVLSRYGVFQARVGRLADARQALDRAAALDPLNARIPWQRAEVELADKRYADARRLAEGSLALNPRISRAHSIVAQTLLLSGDLKGAEAQYRAEPSGLFRLGGLAIVLKRQGKAEAAKAALAQLKAEFGDNGLYQQAQVYAQWDDIRSALDTLRRARAAGDAGLTLINSDPLMEPLRGAPAFRSLQRELGFS
jgi:TolB-like protein/Tfp pilus assembly protein PilF